MGLAATQQLALDRLQALLLREIAYLRDVHVDPPGAITGTPCLVVFDEGFIPERSAQWQTIEWRLRFQAFVAAGKLTTAIKQCRELRGDLIDALDFDITLGGSVSRTTWDSEGLRLAGLEYPPGTEYAGIDGRYTLWIRESKAFQ